MIFEIFCALGLLILLTFAWVVWYGRRGYGVLENCGFPVIPPTLFLGSDPNFYKDVQHLKDVERHKKYGPIWGLYWGQIPHVFVADPELTRTFLVKDSSYFFDRREANLGCFLLDEVLGFLPEEKWRIMRTTLSPLFSTLKMKTMTEVIQANTLEYIQDLKVELESSGSGALNYNCKRRLAPWLMSLFTQATLGVEFNDRKNPNNDFASAFRQLVADDAEYTIMFSLSTTFPFLTRFGPVFDGRPAEIIEGFFKRVIASRQNKNLKAADLIDLLQELISKLNTPEFQKLGISETTIIAQAVIFFIGGYDTSANVLSHFLYYMAKNPNMQDRLHQEIVSKAGKSGSSLTTDHESIRDENMPYLAACVNETLRISPIVPRLDRECNKDWTDGNIKIKKGTVITIASWAIHHDPNYFPDPYTFDPDRFLPENKSNIHPYAFAAFGHGLRNCMGLRFAYILLKTFLAHFILNFKIEVRSDTVLNYKKGRTLFANFDPLYLDISKRT